MACTKRRILFFQGKTVSRCSHVLLTVSVLLIVYQCCVDWTTAKVSKENYQQTSMPFTIDENKILESSKFRLSREEIIEKVGIFRYLCTV